jgi:hypothetical protein
LLAGAIAAIRQRNVTRRALMRMCVAAVASGAIWLRLAMWFAIKLQFPFEECYAPAAWASWLLPLCVGWSANGGGVP